MAQRLYRSQRGFVLSHRVEPSSTGLLSCQLGQVVDASELSMHIKIAGAWATRDGRAHLIAPDLQQAVSVGMLRKLELLLSRGISSSSYPITRVHTSRVPLSLVVVAVVVLQCTKTSNFRFPLRGFE
jgi:hypothetical protein